jgi:hypothetical protein
MIEEFRSLFPACCMSDTWAGFGVIDDEQSVDNGTDRFFAASEALAEEGRAPAATSGPPLPPAASASETGVGVGISSIARMGATTALFQRQNSVREGKAKDWLTLSKTLVPYGRGSYAIWFTIINTSVIIGLFAYMAGDYALWVRSREGKFIQSGTADYSEQEAEEQYKVSAWIAIGR